MYTFWFDLLSYISMFLFILLFTYLFLFMKRLTALFNFMTVAIVIQYGLLCCAWGGGERGWFFSLYVCLFYIIEKQ